jgi:hypothetical protein
MELRLSVELEADKLSIPARGPENEAAMLVLMGCGMLFAAAATRFVVLAEFGKPKPRIEGSEDCGTAEAGDMDGGIAVLG